MLRRRSRRCRTSIQQWPKATATPHRPTVAWVMKWPPTLGGGMNPRIGSLPWGRGASGRLSTSEIVRFAWDLLVADLRRVPQDLRARLVPSMKPKPTSRTRGLLSTSSGFFSPSCRPRWSQRWSPATPAMASRDCSVRRCNARRTANHGLAQACWSHSDFSSVFSGRRGSERVTGSFDAEPNRNTQSRRHDTSASPGIRSNAARSSLTNARAWVRAIAAICRSLAPMVVPFRRWWARSSA